MVLQNQQLVQVIDDACQSIQELAIPENMLAEARIHRVAVGVCEAREEMTKVQLELNIQIIELRLKVQPSTPSEVREQCGSAITAGLDEIGSAVQDCTNMLEESLEVLSKL